MRLTVSHSAEEKDEDHRGHQLKCELLFCGKAKVLFLLQFFPVIQETDNTEDQCKQEQHDVSPVAVEHPLKANRQADKSHGCDEHGTAHGGRSLLGHVPVGSDLQDLLSGFLLSQPRNVILSENS